MTYLTIDCIQNFMYTYKIAITESELRDFCEANSTEDVSTTFDAAMTILLDTGVIAYYQENNTFEIGEA